MSTDTVRVRLIEDDEDDAILLRSLLVEIEPASYKLDWVSSSTQALYDYDPASDYDVYLIDHRLGMETGLELIQELIDRGCQAPIIMLTGHDDYALDFEAMRAGAADYLPKAGLTPAILERTIRYAVEKKKTELFLKQLSAQILELQENERKRVSQILHDDLVQVLSAVKFGIENAIGLLDGESPVSGLLKPYIVTLSKTISGVRNLYTDLLPPILEDFGILKTLDWKCRVFREEHPQIEACFDIRIEEEQVPPSLRLTIYRFLQVVLENVAIHSGAAEMVISAVQENSRFAISVHDNGKGFDPEQVGRSHTARVGLPSIQHRIENTGGRLQIESAPGEGTTVTASWPFNQSDTPV